ncbi:response regulator [Scytonema sp. NUACC21]
MRILLVEDDESLADALKNTLIKQHYLVDVASDGQSGWELAEAFAYDLILLDLMLPKLDGIKFCKQLRQQGKGTPILLLTAQDTSTNKVMGLDAGADDYMVKPFNLQELLARIRALLRRGSISGSPVLEWGFLHLDPSHCEVTYNGQLLHLTSKEYALIELFLRNSRRIFSQSALLNHLWSFEEPPLENTVRAHIKSLRQKLKQAGAEADLIETVYGQGYRLKTKQGVESQKIKQESGKEDTPGSTLIELTHNRVNLDSSTVQNARSRVQISPETALVWERHKQKYSDRMTVLEQAVTALSQGNKSEELQQKALQEAHTLMGSLGSFGFAEASRLCREIEEIFKTEDRPTPEIVQHLSWLVVTLRQQVGQTPVILQPLAPLPTSTKLQSQLLIIDDDAALAQAMREEATTRGMQAAVATDLSSVRIALTQTRPDVVLLDLYFADSQENGFDLLAQLAAYQPPVPVLVFSATKTFAERVKVARLGGQGFLQKPMSPPEVMDVLAQVLQQSNPLDAKLLIVDDDQEMLDFLRITLEPRGFQLTLLNDPQQFWDTLARTAPDLLILDVEMPEITGIELCQVVRNDPRWQDLPVLFLSAHTDIETVQRVFTVGADDYVNKPIVASELVARVQSKLNRAKKTARDR